VTIFCKICRLYVDISDTLDHTKYHDAMNTLLLTQLPATVDSLKEKRDSLIKGINNKYLKKVKDYKTSKATNWHQKVVQLNDAFELLKCYINNTFELNRQYKQHYLKPKMNRNGRLINDIFNFHGESKLSTNNSIVAMSLCSNQNKNHRQLMEDTSTIIDSFGDNHNLTYFGMFDGYGGHLASKYCSEQLHLAILQSLSLLSQDQGIKFNPNDYINDEINHLETNELTNEKQINLQPKNLNSKRPISSIQSNLLNEKQIESILSFRASFLEAYSKMDRLLARGTDERSISRWSGATSCTCIIENDPKGSWIHLANCGDVEAIVIVDNSANKSRIKRNYKILTRLHTVNDCIADRQRIITNGANLIETSTGHYKIKGIIGATRATGFHGDNEIKQYLNATPSIKSYKIETNYVCLIIATKGLWQVLNYEKVADLVLQQLPIIRNVVAYDRSAVSPSVKRMLHQYYSKRDKIEPQLSILNESLFSSSPSTASSSSSSSSSTSNSTLTPTLTARPQVNQINLDNIEEYYSKERSISVPNLKNNNDETIPNYFTNNSDICPISKKGQISNQLYNLQIDIKNKSNDINLDQYRKEPNEMNNDELEILRKETLKQQLNPSKLTNNCKMIQCNDYDLRKSQRQTTLSPKLIKRLEISETIVERLVKCSLLAGSVDNISVNCILLPGSNL
jgi:serine/threonine protein phosphatase PrpC